MIRIGDDVLLDGRVVSVIDTDAIARSALVGLAENGTVWITKWVPLYKLSKVENGIN